MRSIYSVLLSCALGVSPVLALNPAPAPAPAPELPKIETQLPGNTSLAAFVNFQRLFALYGDILVKSHWYRDAQKEIAAGFPDPAKDINQLGIVANLEDVETASAGVVSQGSIDMARAMAWAQSHHLGFTPSNYHGVTLMTTQQDKAAVQVGFVNESTTLLSIDRPVVHDTSKNIIGTIQGQIPSFSATTGITLPANYLGNASLKMTDALRAVLGHSGSWEPISHIDLATASVTSDVATQDAQIDLVVTCDAEVTAQKLNDIVQKDIPHLTGANGPCSKLVASVAGKVLTVNGSVKRVFLEQVLGH